jgi:hypothetical protein
MENSKKWIDNLELHGADFSNWPELPTENDIAEIKRLDEYSEALELDCALDKMTWPELSIALKDKVFSEIQVEQAYKSSFIFFMYKKPLYLAACLALFMFVGLGVGTAYQGEEQIVMQSDMGYFGYNNMYNFING